MNAGEWYHVVTWDSNYLRFYLNGSIYAQSQPAYSLPLISDNVFQIGGINTGESIDAVIDELRISNKVRSAAEVYASYSAGLTLLEIDVTPASVKLMPTWRKTPTVIANYTDGSSNIPPGSLSWSTSNASVATVDVTGQITAVAAGTAIITGSFSGLSDDIVVIVEEPVLSPVYESIDPFLSSPASGSQHTIPVVILRFLPTSDGINLDVSKAPDFWSLNPVSLADLKNTIDQFDQRVKFSVEEGTKFRGYNNASAYPFLGYEVVEYITVYEPLPPGAVGGYDSNGYPYYVMDYESIFERFNLENYVNNQGVQEIWIWDSGGFSSDTPSYDPAIHDPQDFRGGWESNMSSPSTGDISNSNRDNTDLPIYDHTYIVYGQNFRRSQAEAVHNRGHQLEAMFTYANNQQDGNSNLFWKKFVGQDATGGFITGRCGWTHMPPNTIVDYDYYNTTTVNSDIEDWTPDGGGQNTIVSKSTWENLIYAWPGASTFGQQTESQWYLYWMQSMPGFENEIPYNGGVLTNWWEFVADWDASINNGLGLYELESFPGETLNFDGVNDAVIANHDAALELIDGTIEVWLKPQNKASSQTFICYRNSSGSKTRYLFNLLGNLGGVGFWNGLGYYTIPHNFTENEWVHLAFIDDGQEISLWINGYYEGSFPAQFSTFSGTDMQLVLGYDIPLTEYFKGEMDELRIWDHAKTQTEIMAKMDCELQGDECGLVLYYQFNEGNTNVANSSYNHVPDLSTRNNDGFLQDFALTGSTSNWSAPGSVVNTCPTFECTENSPLSIEYGVHSSVFTGTSNGWTHYCDCKGNLLLSLNPGTSGAVIPAEGGVQLEIGDVFSPFVANVPVGFITNPAGGIVMNRKYEIHPSIPPEGMVGVKYYFTNDEFTAIVNQAMYLTTPSDIFFPQDMEMYKVIGNAYGDFPDVPAISNPADVIILSHNTTPSTSTWKYHTHHDGHCAEYLVTSFSGGGGGAGAGNSSLLPVLLSYFKVKDQSPEQVVLEWQTTSESGNDYFEVQRSVDGQIFKKIGRVNGAGHSQRPKNYTFTDFAPIEGVGYYRLKQFDFDGSSQYSNVVLVRLSITEKEWISTQILVMVIFLFL
ncbi:MAG: LamG-like jellyroll fold domain-containing protein [Saprospiraceae bacterium]